MTKSINFIWVILLFTLVFYEVGLCQSQSQYALIRQTVQENPPIWKWTKSVAWSQWGTQLFVDQRSVAQSYFMTPPPDYELRSGVSFHLDNGWNRMLFQECLSNWIRAYGTQGSGTHQFLWPSTIDAHALCNYEGYSPYYFIFVADAGNNRIVKLRWDYQTDNMNWLGTITGGGLDWPQDLDINNGGTFRWNSDDYLWVLNGQQIKRFTMDGVLRKTYGSYGCDGTLGHFCRPTAVVCGRSPWLTPPYDTYANVDWLYVADDGNHRIVLLDKDQYSETITWVKSLSLPSNARISDLEVDNMGQVWAVDWENGRIYKYTMDLYPLCYFGSFGTGEDQFYYPGSFSNTGGYLGCSNVFVAEAWTDSSGGQYFTIGTDVLDFEVTSSVDYYWHYINYTLVDPSHVTIQIYDEENQLIKTVFDGLEYSGACTHVWDGTNNSGNPVGTGDYRIVLADSCRYGDPETQEPVNVVTKEGWIHHSFPSGIAPWNLVVYQSGPDKVTLEWQYYCDRTPWDAFTIYCDGCLCGMSPSLVWTYTDSGLIPGRSYVYWVKAYDYGYESPPSNADTVFLSPFASFSSPGEFPTANNVSNFSGMLNGDTCDLAIEYNSGYPGHFVKMNMLMKNPVPISGFNFLIKLSYPDYIDLPGYPDLVNFHTVDIFQDSILISTDWVDYPVRECSIDTAGFLTSGFSSLFARGQPADTTLSHCKYLWVKGWAEPDSPIPPRGFYDTLFLFGVDLSCICDADTIRDVFFDVVWGSLIDNIGSSIPFRFHAGPVGQLDAWWSVPGDANNDSLVSSADVTFLNNYLFKKGPPPCIPEAADVDSNCIVNSADIVCLINYLFKGGPAPKRGCYCPNLKEEKQTSTFSRQPFKKSTTTD